jgi:hypothetical protein
MRPAFAGNNKSPVGSTNRPPNVRSAVFVFSAPGEFCLHFERPKAANGRI